MMHIMTIYWYMCTYVYIPFLSKFSIFSIYSVFWLCKKISLWNIEALVSVPQQFSAQETKYRMHTYICIVEILLGPCLLSRRSVQWRGVEDAPLSHQVLSLHYKKSLRVKCLINLRTMNMWKVGRIFMFDVRPGRKIVPGRKNANLSALKLLYVHANPIIVLKMAK